MPPEEFRITAILVFILVAWIAFVTWSQNQSEVRHAHQMQSLQPSIEVPLLP